MGVLHALARAALALVLLAAIATAALAWRLSRGPIESAWLAQRLAHAASTPDRTVAIGLARIEWSGGRLVVTSEDVSASGAAVPSVRAEQLSAELPVAPLVLGRVEPGTLTLIRPELRLRHGPQGFQITAPGVAGGDDSASPIASLRQISIVDASVVMEGLSGTPDATIGHATLDAHRTDAGFAGEGGATLQLGGVTTQVALTAAPEGGGTRLTLTAEPLVPAALHLGIEAADGFGAPVGGTASALLTPDLDLSEVRAHLRVGAGPVTVNGQALPVIAAEAEVAGTRNELHLTAARIIEGLPGRKPTTIGLRADGRRTDAGYTAALDVTLDEARFADLAALWPPRVGGPGTRPWITGNIVAGTAHDAAFHIELKAPPDLSDVDLAAATGTLAADDASFYWLRPIPPIEHTAARLRMLDADTIVMTIGSGDTHPDGAPGRLTLRGGTVKLTGLAGKHQFATIDGDIAGQLADALALLHEKRLHLFDHSRLDLPDPSGHADVTVHIFLPLEAEVSMDDVPIHAHTVLHDARLPGLIAGRDLDRGEVVMDTTQAGMTLAGTARLAGIAASLAAESDFRSGPPAQVQYKAHLSARPDAADVARFGIDTGGRFAGSAAVSGDLTLRRDGRGAFGIRADLTASALSAAPLDYRKAAGAPGAFAADVTLDHGRIAGADNVALTGPGLDIRGGAAFALDGPLTLRFATIRLNATDATGTIVVPKDPHAPIRADLSGRTLDLASRFKPDAPTAAPAPQRSTAGAGRPYAVSAAFERVAVAEGQTMTGVSARAESDGTVLTRASLHGTVTGGAQPFAAVIAPSGPRARKLTAQTNDAGGFLRGLGLGQKLTGGALRLSGTFDDTLPNHPLRGTAEMTDFRVAAAASAGKIVQALSVYGIADAMRGPGLYFARLHAPFSYDADNLALTDARAWSSSLGVTVGGTLDLAASRAAMHGTIVPSYALNRLPGRLPLIGKLFSPEDNSGLFAAKFTVTGPLAAPDVSINPLSALTPGALRNLFGAR